MLDNLPEPGKLNNDSNKLLSPKPQILQIINLTIRAPFSNHRLKNFKYWLINILQ